MINNMQNAETKYLLQLKILFKSFDPLETLPVPYFFRLKKANHL